MFNFLKYSKIYLIFSAVLVLMAIVVLIIFGLNFGIDFTGGSILEANFEKTRPQNQIIKEKLSDLNLGNIYIQPTGERGIILRMKDISEQTHQQVLKRLGEVKELRFESVGPVIGKELREKTILFTILSFLGILLYIAFAFRKVSRPLASWRYGVVSIVILFHDIILPVSIFSLLGKFYGVQITIPIVVALLTVVGYSINNGVVVFDRIRENILKKISSRISFREIYTDVVNNSLNQTLSRQINTSLTTLFPLVAIFFFGGVSLKYFSLTLMLGICFGTYSSIFLLTPLLVSWARWKNKI